MKGIIYESMNERDTDLSLPEIVPWSGLPEIPEDYKDKLEEVYLRYEHFVGINLVKFEPTIIEEDRQKYPHLLFLGENGLPVFDEEACLEYMHILSGVPKIHCAIYIYEKNIELVASDLLPVSPLENLQEFYSDVLQLLENIEELKK